MKRTFSAVAVVAMSMAVSASVAGVSQDKIPELQRQGMTDVKSGTLTGCVARATPTDSYTLEETKDTKDAATPATDATPRLTVTLAGTDVDLSKHVGHRVSVTGSYANAEAATGTAGAEKPVPAPAASADGDTKPPKTFTVKSLKMVASSCQQPG